MVVVTGEGKVGSPAPITFPMPPTCSFLPARTSTHLKRWRMDQVAVTTRVRGKKEGIRMAGKKRGKEARNVGRKGGKGSRKEGRKGSRKEGRKEGREVAGKKYGKEGRGVGR